MMDIEKLIERLYKHHTDWGEGRTQDFFEVCLDCKDAATALSTLQAENEKLRETVDKYATAARVIALHLKPFCDESLPYDEMIADAARKASDELEQVKAERDAAISDLVYIANKYPMELYQKRNTRLHYGGSRMAEYIDRNYIGKAYIDLCKALSQKSKICPGANEPTVKDVFALVMHAPVADVVEVRHGRWNNINPTVLNPGINWVCRCSLCGCPQDYKHNYCPNCGALMKEDEHEAG